MPNIGEELVGECLQALYNCDFVSYNLNNPDIQGELDVIGISLRNNKVFFCEVATHLVTGIQYVRNRRPDFEKIYKKFERNKNYADNYFRDKEHVFMLWSPIVKNGRNSQLSKLEDIKTRLKDNCNVELELVINEIYKEKLVELARYASDKTEELKSPILRFLQIQAYLDNHIKKLARKNAVQNSRNETTSI